ncbi:unnamed protein product, partial [Candidula unifasciata]
EDDVDHPKIDEINVEDRLAQSAARSSLVTNGSSSDYSSVQGKPSDNTVHVKSFIKRIVGGSQASYGEIPWQASLKIDTGTQLIQYCGAVIIDQFWLLSAAHCFHQQGLQFRVMVGEYNLYSKDAGEQTFQVDYIYTHEYSVCFGEKSCDYDIALIKIRPLSDGSGISFNRFVQPIRLPDATTSLKVGTPLLVSGWGWTEKCLDSKKDPQTLSEVLMKAEVPLVDQETCKRDNGIHEVTDRMFCAGQLDGQSGSCYGDSGGPIAYIADGSNMLVGIVSWGDGCGQPNKPAVYTQVAYFLDWINNIMQQRR